MLQGKKIKTQQTVKTALASLFPLWPMFIVKESAVN